MHFIYDKPIVDSNKNINVKYLEWDKTTGKLTLISRHVYYTQCQLLMHCSGLNSCELFVYNNIEPILVTVEKNQLFLNNLINKMSFFYFSFFLPKLIDNFDAK